MPRAADMLVNQLAERFGAPVPSALRLGEPYWQTTDQETARVWLGDVRAVLAALPERSVHMVVTSPPYWSLRSYLANNHEHKHLELGTERVLDCVGWTRGENCAARGWAEGCYVCRVRLICQELKRVLRDDGVMWWNHGDSYGNNGICAQPWRVALALQADGWVLRQDIIWAKPSPMPESVQNRCTKAHEYLFLLTKRMGYYYDAEAIKEDTDDVVRKASRISATPGLTPEGGLSGNQGNGKEFGGGGKSNKRSVWTISSQGYPGAHFATFPPALVTPCVLAGSSEHGCCADCGAPWKRVLDKLGPSGGRQHGRKGAGDNPYNAEDQWGLAAGGAGANWNTRTLRWEPTCTCHGHFVKHRVKVARGDAIGLPEYPGSANQSVVVAGGGEQGYHPPRGWAVGAGVSHATQDAATEESRQMLVERIAAYPREVERTVWEYLSELPLDEHPVVPCTVLDPFLGSGTSVATALALGRRGWGIDLSEAYLRKNAVPRIEGVLLARPAWVGLVPHTGPTAAVADLGPAAQQEESLEAVLEAGAWAGGEAEEAVGDESGEDDEEELEFVG